MSTCFWIPSTKSVLSLLAGDQEIFQLCVAAERSRLLYRLLAALLQGVAWYRWGRGVAR